ncbi:DUF2628 domain-containing protein [Bacillus sp. H-16]|uniref:DUF2628 domain-containing protein n=1 Tax=Alteribacter salitolerans TaxID=2912333 RepID=UPI00196281F0|nr:DUF2628 domain-containing protein [Alteribacter salitolerans]MBM7096780.1 DUF2628 domain-containing protein [Alteribacter salitolerans]
MSDTSFGQMMTTEKKEIKQSVQINDSYYIKKWSQSKAPERFAGWNWAAFILSPFWFSYRRMFGWASLYFLVLLVYSFADSFIPYVQYVTGIEDASVRVIGWLFVIAALHLISGAYGNALYAKKIKKSILAKRNQKPDRAQVPLFSQSGASIISAIVAPLVIVIFAFYPFIISAEWEYSPGFPKGAFVYLDEYGAPDTPWELEQDPEYYLFSSSLMLFYENKEPIGRGGLEIEMYKVDGEGGRELILERSETFFRSSTVNIPLLDTGHADISAGDYEVDVYVEEELQDTATFTMVSPHS